MYDKFSLNILRNMISKTEINSNDSLIELIKSIKRIELIAFNKRLSTFKASQVEDSYTKKIDKINMTKIDQLKLFSALIL